MNSRIINWLGSSPSRMFRLDAGGALLTAALTAGVLAPHEAIFGMPAGLLYWMAAVAGGFALYSFTCSLLRPRDWQMFLKGIAFANAAYAGTTIGLVVYHRASVTAWGMAYFAGEVLIVGALVYWELRVAGKKES